MSYAEIIELIDQVAPGANYNAQQMNFLLRQILLFAQQSSSGSSGDGGSLPEGEQGNLLQHGVSEWQVVMAIADMDGVRSINYNTRVISDAAGSESILYDDRKLIDSTGLDSMDYENRSLLDSSNLISVNYTRRRLINQSDIISMDWELHEMYDQMQSPSIDYNARYLYDSSNNIAIDYSDPDLLTLGRDTEQIKISPISQEIVVEARELKFDISEIIIELDGTPGASPTSTSPDNWIRVSFNGVLGYIPFYNL